MKTFEVMQSKLEPGKIEVLCRNNEAHSSVWALTPAEFAALTEVLHAQYVPAITEAWQQEKVDDE